MPLFILQAAEASRFASMVRCGTKASWNEYAAASAKRGTGCQVTAELRFEEDNSHDADAIAVWIDGERVGYVPAGIARLFRAAIERINPDGLPITCDAKIVGGWKRGNGDEGHYGVNLSLADPLRVAKGSATKGP